MTFIMRVCKSLRLRRLLRTLRLAHRRGLVVRLALGGDLGLVLLLPLLMKRLLIPIPTRHLRGLVLGLRGLARPRLGLHGHR